MCGHPTAGPAGGWAATLWAVILGQTRGLLACVAAEMARYVEERSEAWQNSERGEEQADRVKALEEILDLLNEASAAARR